MEKILNLNGLLAKLKQLSADHGDLPVYIVRYDNYIEGDVTFDILEEEVKLDPSEDFVTIG